MARVTASEVREIIETDLTDQQLAPMIAMAAMETGERLTGLGISEARLTEIERWLSAHFVAASLDPRRKSQGVSGASETFEGQQGMGLESTRYGQQAIVLDTTGTLAGASKGQSAKAEFSCM
jgi:hypothetical protein